MDFITARSRMPGYMIYPRFLLNVPVNDTARTVYITLLDRARLSLRNGGWTDKAGHVYLVYPVETLAGDLHRGVSSVKDALTTLEHEGLIVRKRQGVGRACHIYVKLPEDTPQPVFRPYDSRNSGSHAAGFPAPNKNKRTKITQQNNYGFRDYEEDDE